MMKPISSEPESCSIEQILRAQQGDEQALEWVIKTHRRLISILVMRFQCEWSFREELLQAGQVGLMMALRSFDSSKAVRLSTYAVPWILGEMRSTFKRIGTAHYSLDEPRGEEGNALVDILVGNYSVNLAKIDLRLALAKLSREDQILISLRYFRGKTQKESALILRKSQAQISKTENRILEQLRLMLS